MFAIYLPFVEASHALPYSASAVHCAVIDCRLATHATDPMFITSLNPVTLVRESGSFPQSASQYALFTTSKKTWYLART